MAIDTDTTFAQAPLDDLHAESDLKSEDVGYSLPKSSDLDPGKIEIIVDLDLDEMLLYYFGRDIPHDVEPGGELVSYLVEQGSDRVVGVIVHEYVSRAIREYPALAEAMRWAIFVSGDQIRNPEFVPDEGAGLVGRLKDQWRRRAVEIVEEDGRERTAAAIRSLLAAG